MDSATDLARSATEISTFSATFMSMIYILSRFVKLDPSDDYTASLISNIVVPIGLMGSMYVAIVVSNFLVRVIDDRA
jgi:hypothetical protein